MTTNRETLEVTLTDPWVILSDEARLKFSNELKNETCKTHPLYGLELTPVARRDRRDDFLFLDIAENTTCYIVHLTWKKETKPDWPWFTTYNNYEDFLQNWRKHFD